ncbi:MAG: hypothetical protein FGM27_08730, partial [Candidatus Omnitrophica bacterium]|nr:hypothetical protein [Candidatus Omnitrophota bacterium]
MKKTAPQTFYDLIQKPTAILLLSVFLPTQTFTVYASPIDPASLTGDPGRETSSVNTSEAASSEAKTQANLSEPLDTGNFLSQDNPLREKTEAERSNRYAEDVGVPSQVASDYALAEVDNDVAVAGILAAPLSADDFKASALNRHEAAHMVIDGQVVYLTTGRATEILLHPVAAQLLAAAASEGRVSAIYHNHLMGQNPEPSLADIAAAKNFPGNLKFYSYGYNARGQFEAYAFNGDGVLNKDKPMSAEALAGEMNASVSAGAVSMETREFLSEFIAAVDYYNESKIDARELFSQGPTVFPGYPTLGSFASSSPSATVSVGQSSTELFGMAYNVSNAGSFVGSYMDFGVTTPADLSGFSNFIFEMRTDNINASGNQVKVEFVDTSNRRGVAFISGLNGTMKQIEILPAQLTGADLTRIKQIIFVVDSGMAAAKPNGFIEIRTGGLDYNPAIGPVSNPDAYPVTPLPNKSNRERVSANGFASPDGSSTQVNLASSTFMTLTYNGLAADSYGGVFMSYDDPETAGIPDSETINLAAAYPVGITLSLDNANTGLNSVVLEISDNQGNVDFVTLTSIEGFGKKWVIPTSLFDRIDITKVAIISLVVTGRARDKKLNVDWGNFYRDPIVAPVPDPDNYSISPLPKKSDGARPSLSKFASSDGTRMDLS